MAKTAEETRLESEQALLRAKALTTSLSEAEQARLLILQDMIQAQITLRNGLEAEKQLTLEAMQDAQRRVVDLKARGATQEEINEAEQDHQHAIIANLKAQLDEEVALNGVMSARAVLLRQGIRDQEKFLKQQNDAVRNQQKMKDLADSMTGGLVSQVTSYFTIAGLTKNIADLFGSIMQGNVDYAKTTGQVADRTLDFGYGASQFGIGFEQMNKSAMTLFTSMSGFSDLNKEIQADLAMSSAKLENLGVASETSGKNMDILMKTFKMSTGEAIKTNEELARVAIGAGIAPSKMLAGFAENMPRLAAYGKQAIQVYADLQKQAKSLGLEVSTLTSIVGDTMDTFEGSAKAAGKFNAVLGGNYLNSIEMLNATESERVVILKKAFEQSGKNFDSLSKYEKKAIAATLGIQNLDDATKLFSKSSAELAMDQAKQAASQEKLEQVQREAAKTTDQIKELFNGLLIVIRPIVTGVKNIVDVFTYFNDKGKGIPSIVLGIATAFFTLKKAFDLSTAMNKTTLIIMGIALALQAVHYWLLEPHSPILFFALMALPVIIYAIGKAAESSQKGLYALGAAFMMLGTGVYIAASGLANLVQSFNGLGDAAPYAAAAVGAFTLAFFGLMALLLGLVSGPQALLTGAAIGVLLSVGGAAMMIGAGMGLAAFGVSKLIDSFSELTKTLVSLGNLSDNFSVLARGIQEMSESLELLPEEKIVSIKNLNDTLQTVKSITKEDVEPTKQLMMAVKDYYESQKNSKDADKDALVAALKEVVGNINLLGGEEGSKSIPIKLIIGNGRELAAELRPLMREKYKSTLGPRG